MNTTLQIRIDAKTKARARRALEGMGLDLSSGIKLFLTQVSITGELPFRPRTAQNLPMDVVRKLTAEADSAAKRGKRYKTAKEVHNDILGA
jgi:addiction module RelB/DinJ family antitoxin